MKQTKIQHFMIDPPWPLENVARGREVSRFLKGTNDSSLKGKAVQGMKGNSRDLLVRSSLGYKSTIQVPDIFELLDDEVLCQAAKIHHVYLWTLDKYIFDSEIEMSKRGYKRHVITIWDKKDGAPPRVGTLRMYHEFMVWYYKPTLIRPVRNMMGRLSTVMRESQRQHSRKPECSYSLIERLYPNQTYMDVFSRQSREGWHQFGNEKDYFPSFEKVLRI